MYLNIKEDQMKNKLLSWYQQHKRDLPWRHTCDPYAIWISEVMLQQTTSTAVIPYYQRFLKAFPNLRALAQAPQEEVLSLWTGLGYYSRARNLHKSAQLLAQMKAFPKTYTELMKLPGFGPYTARAVTSFAFNESVGVLDGNVIRFLSRHYGLSVAWWTPAGRQTLQEKADEWASTDSALVNQALMEIGATVCTPQNPSCLICPVSTQCQAIKTQSQDQYPLKKEKPEKITLVWEGELIRRTYKGQTQLALVKNQYAPFLKGQWILPGTVKKVEKKPDEFDFKHSITKYEIFAQVKSRTDKKYKSTNETQIQWVPEKDIKKWTPSSLIQKSLSLLSLLPFLFYFTGCQTSQKTNTRLTQNFRPMLGERLTSEGSNTQAVFSANGQSLLFVSRYRPQHPHSQIYQYQFQDKKTKRLTYQLGEVHSPAYSPFSEKIYYFASTTDEEKENFLSQKPQVSLQLAPLFPDFQILPYELYSNTFSGTRIQRLTQHKGWDSQVQLIKKNSIVYSKQAGSQINLVQYNLKNKSQLVLISDGHLNTNPQYSPIHKALSWVRYLASDQDGDRSPQVYYSSLPVQDIQALPNGRKSSVTPHWHPLKKWIAYAFPNEKTGYDIEIWNLEESCSIPLITQPGDDLWPHFSPDGKSLLYSNNDSGQFQIYHYPIPENLSCVPQ